MKVVILLLAFGALALLVGCDPGHDVTYENQTSHAVTVFLDGYRDIMLKPLETHTTGNIEFRGPETIEAKDESGRTIFSETLTWDDIKHMGWKVTIVEQSSPVAPSPTPD